VPEEAEQRREGLVRTAMDNAYQRLLLAGADEDAVFAPLGELLFWVVAADDVLLGSAHEREHRNTRLWEASGTRGMRWRTTPEPGR
jgi:hypothetical protein